MQLIKKTVLFICCLAFVAGCSAGRTAFSKAEKLEQEGKLDEAVLQYAEASMADPETKEYRLRLLKVSEAAARLHLAKGDDFLAARDYDNALREYQTAVAIEPSQERARQQAQSTMMLRDSRLLFKEGESLEKGQKTAEAYRSYKKAAELDPSYTEAKEALRRILQNKKTKLDGFELNLKSNKPITLKFKDTKIKDVFNILTRLSGINFIFDDAVKDQNISILLDNATFHQALDVITNMNKLGRKVLNANTIIVYPKTPDKAKQYEELVVKTFILNNLDAKKAINLLRTMLQIRKIYVNEDLNAIVIRDVPETIEVAQRILEANDQADAEVILEVEVIELTKSNEEIFGLKLSNYAVTAAATTPGTTTFLSDTFTPTTTTTSTPGTTVSNMLNIFNWRGFGGFLTVPNATYNFGKTLSNAEVLANPKIRVKNREKSKFNVATREPITTISTTGTTGGFSTNVQYVDVGIKLNAEPTILSNNEINLKLSLEVSSKLGEKTAQDGTTLITIGTRNLDTVLSLKDGETSVIGGLISANKNKTTNKIFILGDIPIVGPLISGHNNKRDKTELVLALTPRIIRLPAAPEPDLASFWSGKEDEPTVSAPFAAVPQEPDASADQQPQPQRPAAVPEAPPASSPAPLVAPAPLSAPAPQVAPAPLVSPITLPAVPTTPVSPLGSIAPIGPAAATASPSPQAQAPAAVATLSMAAPAAVPMGDQFAVEVRVADVRDLLTAPMTLVYDPSSVDFIGAAEGGFLRQDGKQTNLRTTNAKGTGQLKVELARVGKVGGVSGSGTLISVLFKARKKGLAPFSMRDIGFASAAGAPIGVTPFNVAVEVR